MLDTFRATRRAHTRRASSLGWCLLTAAPLLAQDARPCGTDPERSVAAAEGRRIIAITVQTSAPDPLVGGISAPLHVTTREHTVRRRLLFAVGDAIDSLRVFESLRALRRLRYLAGARIVATCDDRGSASLSVITRDAWSLRPRLALHGTARSTAGVEETNLFGTGRSGRLYVRSDDGQLGVGASYTDPTLFGDRAVGTVGHDAYADGSRWGGTLRSHDAGVFAPWEVALALQLTARHSVARTPASAVGDTVRRATSVLLVSRRLTFSPAGATYLQFGAEAERTALVAGPELPIVGPSTVRRTFAGADVGVARRSGHFADTPWLLPPSPNSAQRTLTRAEVPLGVELDGILGFGRDVHESRFAAHLDAWAGRVWPLGWRTAIADSQPVPAALVSVDLWASGYRSRGDGEWSGGTARASVALTGPAAGGLWTARVSAEQLVDPDPDVRGLALADPAFRAVPRSSRFAESAVTASFERSLHLRPVTRGYVLDAAVFGAGSIRWDGASPVGRLGGGAPAIAFPTSTAAPAGSERLFVGTLGAGLRLTPTRFGPATIRLDVGLPVLHSPALRGTPYLGISITPAFGTGRRRVGRAGLGNQ